MNRYLFLTGATGLLGRYLLCDLMQQGHRLAVLVRGSKRETPRERMEAILQHWEERLGKSLPRPVVIEGDICQDNLGLTEADTRWLARNCKAVLHSAASLQFLADGSGEPHRSNFGGTENMLSLCETANLQELHYVSTAYVCGLRQGKILESELDCDQAFRNDYEESKLKAEKLVRSNRHIQNLTVYRPAVISGDSQTGYTNTYHGIYLYLRLMSLLVPRQPLGPDGKRVTQLRLPMTGEERRNVIPVDWVSKVITKLYSTAEAHGRTFHLAPETCLTPKLLIDAGYSYFGSTGVEYIGDQKIDPSTYNAFEAEILPSFTMYSNYERTDPTFDCTNTKTYAPELPCPIIDETMIHTYMRYGEEDRWGKRRVKKGTVKLDAKKYFENYRTVSCDPPCSSKIAFDILGPGGGQWTFHRQPDQSLAIEPGIKADDSMTVRVSIEEFEKMISSAPWKEGQNAHPDFLDHFFPAFTPKIRRENAPN